MTTKKTTEPSGFDGLGIAPKLLEILTNKKFTTPTPIQVKSIPVSIEGKDVVGIAQTGTGKTLAFGVPMIQRLARHKGNGLVVLPTRELALQVDENLRLIGSKVGLRTAVLIGGEAISRQLQALRKNPHIIVATPGRLIDHLENKNIKLDDVKILVLDEADMMFDMGFQPQVEKILKAVPKERQTMLFSATMPPEIMKIVQKHMHLPVSIEVAPAGTASENIDQEMLVVRQDEKIAQLEKTLAEYSGSVLIFSRTKHNAKKLNIKIKQMGHKSAEIHSNRSLVQRREALDGFKAGKYRILVATDIAARGIDVKGIELVINYDLPDNSEDYVHRIGRTGRADMAGKAISFVLPGQLKEVKTIERLIKKNIPVTDKGQKVEIRARAREERPKKPAHKNREKRKQDRFGRGDKRDHPARGRSFQGDDFITAFNPFKETERTERPRRHGEREDRRQSGSAGKHKNRHSEQKKNERFLTDKQRFKRSMTSRTS